MLRAVALLLALLTVLCSCGDRLEPPQEDDGTGGATADITDIGFKHAVDDPETTMTVTCLEGTQAAYALNDGVLTFSGLTEDSIYSVTGVLGGNIVIDIGDEFKLELVLEDALIQSSTESPIVILSGDKVTLTAKKDTASFIYDLREGADTSADGVYAGAIHAACDLTIGGKGSLTVESESNNGIHTKDDLKIKNLSLTVTAVDNALKGNDSVTVESGRLVLIARKGDGIKTSKSGISAKGNQRGDISLLGGRIDIYAACDGIDAAHDAVIEGDTLLNIYTDKYSDYSEEVTAFSESLLYIRSTVKDYSYSVKFENASGASLWRTAELTSEGSAENGGLGGRPGGRPDGRPGGGGGGRPGGTQSATYYYYKLEKPAGYDNIKLFIYSSGQSTEQDKNYLAASQEMTVSDAYDTIAIELSGDQLRMGWTNYSTSLRPGGFGGGFGGPGGPGGMGGMNDGNRDKLDHSAKGIKAANEISISGGTLFIKSYDDALHANADATLENSLAPTGNVSITDGTLTLYSNDDAVHADGTASVSGGKVTVTSCYEGIEGNNVLISGGSISICSSDDGVNATATSEVGITISGGELYVLAGGDGLDSNSRSSYRGIVFSGGRSIVISTSGGDSAIDTEQGYSYSGGYVLALMPSGGMSNESTHCQSFSSVAQQKTQNISEGDLLTVEGILTFKIPTSLRALIIFLGDTSAELTISYSKADANTEDIVWHG